MAEPWWRDEYGACVAAYRIDDPVIDVAAARLAHGPWEVPGRSGHPLDWAPTALIAEVRDRGGWSAVRRRLTSSGCSTAVVDAFEAELAVEVGDLDAPARGRRPAGEVSLVQASRRLLVVDELEHYEGHVTEEEQRTALQQLAAEMQETVEQANALLSGKADWDAWAEGLEPPGPYDWVGFLYGDWANPHGRQPLPCGPAVVELWRRSLEWLPDEHSAAWYVGANLEDLFQLSMGAWWAWGPGMVRQRVEIIDAGIGESANATNALSGCWIRPDDEAYGPWRDVLRRRGVDVDP